MNTKALFLDLDGTLLNDQKKITDGNRLAIQRALAAGHKIIINTGRPLVSAILQAEKLGLTSAGCYLIAYNGGILYDTGNRTILSKKALSLELVRKVFDEANRRSLHIQTYSDTHVLVEPRCDDAIVKRYCSLTQMSYQVIPDIHLLAQEPVKMLLIDLNTPALLEDFSQWISTLESGQLDSFFSSNEYLEVVSKGLNKGNALKEMARLLQIPMEHTVAAGDAANDIEMLRAAHVGVSMHNGTDQVKAAADYITARDNNHDGVAEIIETFIL